VTRLDGEGSVFPIRTGRQAGKWRCELVVGWHPDGRKITQSRVRATERDAQRALRELANQRDEIGVTNRGPARDQWRLGDWCDHWLEEHARERKIEPSTRDVYATQIRVSIRPIAGTVRLDRVTAGTIRKILSGMTAGASSQKQTYVVLNAALGRAARDRLIPRNPADDVPRPTVKHTKMDPPLGQDIEAIYAAVQGAPDEARWSIALALGLRRGEALGLEWADLDFDAMTLRVHQQLVREYGAHGCGDPTPRGRNKAGRWLGNDWPCGWTHTAKCPQGRASRLILKEVKTDQGNRVLPILSGMVPMLERIQRQQQKDLMIHGRRYRVLEVDARRGKTRPADLVFRTPLGRAVDPRADDKAWHGVLAAAGLQPTRLHNARHSAAVSLIDSGVPMSYVSDLLGHTDFAFTKRVYGHRSPAAANASRAALEDLHARLQAGAQAVAGVVVPLAGEQEQVNRS
jgi:integrase